MLIDNKVDRYDDGLNITTVWDFLNEFSGKKVGKSENSTLLLGTSQL